MGVLITGTLIFVITKNYKKNQWIKPVDGPLTSGFGMRKHPVTGESKLHNGQDIGVGIGTKVFAPRNGTVHNTTPTADGGNQIVIIHDNGWFTGYAHLSKLYVKPGQKVKQGDLIALTGNTGQSTGPHLHFTLTNPKGEKIDPKIYIYK